MGVTYSWKQIGYCRKQKGEDRNNLNRKRYLSFVTLSKPFLTVVGELSHSCIKDVLLLYQSPLLQKSHEGALGWVQNQLENGTWRVITNSSLSKWLSGFCKCLLWIQYGSIKLSMSIEEKVCALDIQWWEAARRWKANVRIQKKFAGWKNVHFFLSQRKCTSSRLRQNTVQIMDGDNQLYNTYCRRIWGL